MMKTPMQRLGLSKDMNTEVLGTCNTRSLSVLILSTVLATTLLRIMELFKYIKLHHNLGPNFPFIKIDSECVCAIVEAFLQKAYMELSCY